MIEPYFATCQQQTLLTRNKDYMSTLSPLFNYAQDGLKFYKAVMARVSHVKPFLSLNALCEQAGIAFSTTHRWKNGSKPDTDTVVKLEKAFKHFERQMAKYQAQGSSPEHVGM